MGLHPIFSLPFLPIIVNTVNLARAVELEVRIMDFPHERVTRQNNRQNVSRQSASNVPGLSSHYNDLRQLEPEEDLIQLESRPPTPRVQSHNLDTPVTGLRISTVLADAGISRIQTDLYVR